MSYPYTFDNILELIGQTPVIRLNKVIPKHAANVWAKLELLNPGGSIKDRICLNMINAAENQNLISPGKNIIVEATSGNTGIGLALVCKLKGYKLILTMPEDMSIERQQLLKAYGAEPILTNSNDKMEGAINKAKEITNELNNAYMLNQFDNINNPQVHFSTTGPELYDQIPGTIDAFVAGVSTGGCISGVGNFLKQKYPDIKLFAVEPYECAVLSGKKPDIHDIQGIGAGFVPKNLNTNIYDDVIQIKSKDAKLFTKEIARKEGLLVGISSGATALASKELAEQLGPNKQVATIFCDSGERYLSTELFNNN